MYVEKLPFSKGVRTSSRIKYTAHVTFSKTIGFTSVPFCFRSHFRFVRRGKPLGSLGVLRATRKRTDKTYKTFWVARAAAAAAVRVSVGLSSRSVGPALIAVKT